MKGSDYIAIHTTLTPQTRGLIGEKELRLVKPSARIINVARGGIVDEEALYKAVEEGRIAGAAVDVFSKEPPGDNILFKSDRIIVTPHLGASTSEAQERVALDVAEQIVAIFRGEAAAVLGQCASGAARRRWRSSAPTSRSRSRRRRWRLS